MCQHRIINPGLPAEQFDSFDSDDDSPGPIEDEHHIFFEWSGLGYTEARVLFQDLFGQLGQQIVTVGQFLNQPNHHRLAKFLTWARMMRMNLA